MLQPRSLILLYAFAGFSHTVHSADLPPDQVKFFESKIRPVLSTACYKCHSQAQGKSKGGLTLDTKAGWEKGGDSGPSIHPGDPEASPFIKAIRYTDEDMKMPPPQSGGQLKPEQIADLEAWVKMGAPDPRLKAVATRDIANIAEGLTEDMQEKAKTHWAFQPVQSPKLPTVNDAAWCRTPVDQFILAKLEEKGLKPSPSADKRTLIRRAYIDLIGLPPTPKEVLDFVQDNSPNAFEKVVDQLLARPQYGERWGRYWLDVARYADTLGEVKKQTTPLSPYAWTYRDYVIKAFNSDRPFNTFIKEQIAADQLPTAKTSPQTLAAMGFLTEGDQFGGNRNDILNDQIDVVTKGFLGLTVSCSRCHDHFFDPVPLRDYYSLHGIFNSSVEPESLPIIGKPDDAKLVAQYDAERKKLVAEGFATLDGLMLRLAAKFNGNAKAFLSLIQQFREKGGRPNDPQAYALLKKAGLDANDVQSAIRSLQQQVKLHRETMAGGPDIPKQKGDKDKKNRREDRKAGRDFEHPVLGLLQSLGSGKGDFAARASRAIEALDPKEANPLVLEAFKGKKPASLEEVIEIYAALFARANEAYKAEHPMWKKSAPENALYPGLRDPNLEAVRSAVFSVKPYLKDSFEEIVPRLGRDEQKAMARYPSAVSAMDLTHPGSVVRANVLVDAKKPQDSAVLYRGEAQNKGPVVPRHFLTFLQPNSQPYPKEQSGRLQLAEAIASEKNPLTPRVLVNRVWLHHFGEGFVNTPDDLGSMSEPPSHPELCNWLSAKFMADGWSLKKLHKLIMTSAVYQQASDPNEEFAKVDPFNRLLWRANVRRLDFESLRDGLLAIGGKLDFSMFGHPVNIESEPYSPRRSIYGFVDRLNTAEFMKHFDMANAQLPTGRRHQTIVPQQSLFRMNSLLVIEQARNIVDRPEFRQSLTDQDKVKALYEIIFQRWPKPEELKLAFDFIRGPADTSEPDVASNSTSSERMMKNEKVAELLEADPKTLNPKQRERQEELKKRLEARDKQMAAAKLQQAKKNGNSSAIKELVRDPNAEKVDRSALDAWEKFAHALLMTNEVAYVN